MTAWECSIDPVCIGAINAACWVAAVARTAKAASAIRKSAMAVTIEGRDDNPVRSERACWSASRARVPCARVWMGMACSQEHPLACRLLFYRKLRESSET